MKRNPALGALIRYFTVDDFPIHDGPESNTYSQEIGRVSSDEPMMILEVSANEFRVLARYQFGWVTKRRFKVCRPHRVGTPSCPGAPLTEPCLCCSHTARRD